MSGRFNVEMERDILAKAISDPAYRERARRVLTKHSFTDPDHGWLWQTMAAMPAGDIVTAPTVDVMIGRVSDSSKRASYTRTFKRLDSRTVNSANTALSLLGDFVRHATMTGGIEKAIKALKSSDLDAAQVALKRASQEGPSALDTIDWIEEWDDRTTARAAAALNPSLIRQVPTRLKHLDKWLNGGLRRGNWAWWSARLVEASHTSLRIWGSGRLPKDTRHCTCSQRCLPLMCPRGMTQS